jgi:hypothetical protein
MVADNGAGFVVLGVLAAGYLLPSIIATLRGCRRAWLYWMLNITLGWSVCMWAYLMFRAVFVDHQNDNRYSRFPYVFRD